MRQSPVQQGRIETMCGRVALFSPTTRLARLLDATLAAGIDPEGEPSWNLGPMRTLFGVTGTPDARVLDGFRWGLIPSWSKNATVANLTINARCETVAEKPSFREAFIHRPCAIPVDGFFEWGHLGNSPKQPHYFTRRDGEPMVFAGLYEYWKDPSREDAPVIATCTVITTEPGEDIDGIHDRQPVVLELADVDRWINTERFSPAQRHELLVPSPKGVLTHVGVGKAVGSIYNDGPEMIVPEAPQSLF